MSAAAIEQVKATAQSPAHEAALKMAELGFRVFPLWGIKDSVCGCEKRDKCPSPGKHPRRMAGIKDATSSHSVINAWFNEPGLNYGVAMGVSINGNGDKKVVVIDVDDYKEVGSGPLNLLTAQHGNLPDTAEVMTGRGGRHLYFMAPVGVEFAGKLGSNIDFKTNGYVVGPGSLHASGKRYEWEGSSDLFEGHEITDLPHWVIDNFKKQARVAEPVSSPCLEPLSAEEIQRIRSALWYIQPDGYEDWIEVLMALKSTGDDKVAFAIADAWSKRSAKYKPDEMRQKWSDISPSGGITLGTLFDKSQKAYIAHTATADLSRLLKRLNAAWQEPQPLVGTAQYTPYPINALPLIVRDAVVEVQQFVQAPMAMVACSALATLSLAAQSLFDVERAATLSGPIGLYLLAVADSGERKSTLDSYFSKAIMRFEQEQIKEAEPLLVAYNAAMTVWEAKKNGLAERVKRDAKEDKNDEVKKTAAQLHEHEASKPDRPLIPRLIYSDTTPEALMRGIATEWPSVGLLSSEGGIVFGGHGMSKDSQLRNMAVINQLWDGKPARIDRTTSGSYTAEGRLTVAIQVQAPTLKSFFNSAGDLPRGTGFMARFLVACPKSTQGTRLYNKPPAQWLSLDRFDARITEILNMPQPIENGRLQPPKLYLSTAAQAVWIKLHDELEVQLGDCGELHEVRDVASKAADNAARMAALFHVVEGARDTVSEENMANAAAIVRWHLTESMRVLGNVAIPAELSGAAKLDEWLIDKCNVQAVSEFTFTHVQQHGPGGLRKKDKLDAAANVLISLNRIKVVGDSPRVVKVNPALLQSQ